MRMRVFYSAMLLAVLSLSLLLKSALPERDDFKNVAKAALEETKKKMEQNSYFIVNNPEYEYSFGALKNKCIFWVRFVNSFSGEGYGPTDNTDGNLSRFYFKGHFYKEIPNLYVTYNTYIQRFYSVFNNDAMVYNLYIIKSTTECIENNVNNDIPLF